MYPYDVKELLSIFVGKSDNGYAMYDKQDRVIYCNQNYAQIFECDLKDIIGLTFSESIKTAFKTQKGLNLETDNIDTWIDKANKKRWQKNYRTFEIDLKNGGWLLISEQIIDNDFLFVQSTDITVIKKLEKQLIAAKEKLTTLAYNDELTRIPNRRAFLEHAYREIQKSFRNKTPLFLYLFDIDYFKSINDQFGHLAGDIVLKSLTGLIKEELREYDFLARIGGDEFALLFTDITKKSALSTVERIREKVEKADFKFNGNNLSLTVSLGGTKIKEGDLLDDLIGRADSNLYQAKRLGRNKVVFSECDDL